MTRLEASCVYTGWKVVKVDWFRTLFVVAEIYVLEKVILYIKIF
nr:MAG TPA: hypothetical protein [Caudoviricetes sp.]